VVHTLAHFSRALRDVLKNPQDFYLWRHLKALIYAAFVDNEETLQHRIAHACQTIRNYPGICERMRRSMMKRALNIMEDIFEQSL
jgi:hypothetical protein